MQEVITQPDVEQVYEAVKSLFNAYTSEQRWRKEYNKMRIHQLRRILVDRTEATYEQVQKLNKFQIVECLVEMKCNRIKIAEQTEKVFPHLPGIYTLANKFFIIDLDDGVYEVVASKKDAIRWCRATCLDYRKNPTIKNWNSSFEYTHPDARSWFFGTWDGLRLNGWSHHLDSWLKDWVIECLEEKEKDHE